jgi:dolichol-phosphate mannosyltransferase
MKNLISIIIPTYNERENIVNLVNAIRTTLNTKKILFEIIIVDDNSPDRTAETVNKNFRKDKNIHLFLRKKDRGLGSAILFGIKKSKGNIIVGMDADFNHPPEVITSLINQLKDCNLVIGSRFIKGGGMEDKTRYLLTYIFNLFLKHILGFPTMDNMSGFYAIKKEKLMKLPINKIYQGYGEYHLRLVYLAHKLGLKIKEEPVFYKKRRFGKSKSNLTILFFKYIWEGLRLKRV